MTKKARDKIRIWFAGAPNLELKRRLHVAAPELELVGAPQDEPPPDLVMLAREDYERLVDDAEGKTAAEVHARTAGEERVPIEVARRLVAGENPIRVWREHRGMTLDQVSARAGIGKGYLSEIENGKRTGPVQTLQAIARALDVGLDEIAPRQEN
jgi:DNA-binding XRE family transcriptional regulator